MAQSLVISKPTPAGYARVRRNPLYDTDVLPAVAINQVVFFQRPQGQPNASAIAKTEQDTNLTMAGMLAQPQFFDLFGYQFEYVQTAAHTYVGLIAIYNTGVFAFTLGGDRKFTEVPLTRVPNGPQIIVRQATVVAVDVLEFGDSGAKEHYSAVQPKGEATRIKSGETFQARVWWPTAPVTPVVNTMVRVYLVGLWWVGI